MNWPGVNHSDLIFCYLAGKRGLEVAHNTAVPLHSIKHPAKHMDLPYPWPSMNEHTI